MRRGAPWPLHGPDLSPLPLSFVKGRLFSSPPVLHPPLLSSGPLPSLPSHPSPPLSRPRGGRKPCLVLRERGRVLWEESQKSFPQRGSRVARVIHRKQRCSGHRRPQTRPMITGLREKKRTNEKKRKKEVSDDDDI